MISLFKRAWKLWSELLTFEWLERLSDKQPRLAAAITGSLISLAFALFAWYYLDSRFRLYEKGSNIPSSWTFRYFAGGVSLVLMVLAVTITVLFGKNDAPVIWEFSFGKRHKNTKRK